MNQWLHWILIPLLVCLILLPTWGQGEREPGLRWVDSILHEIHTNPDLDAGIKSNLADSAYKVALRENDLCKQLSAKIRQATYLDNMGMSDSALTQLYWVNNTYSDRCDSSILMSLYTNLTNVYLSLNELSRVDSVSTIALSLYNPLRDDTDVRYLILNNLAIAQATRGDADTATATFRQALKGARADRNMEYVQKMLLNLGSIKGMTGDLDSAYYFLNEAALVAQQSADMENYMSLLINLATLDRNRGNYRHAEQLLDTAYTLAEGRKNAEMMANVQSVRADLFATKGDFRRAFNYQKEFIKIKEQYLDEERVKAVNEMMARYESEKKARQIQQLELENLDATLENERIRNGRNRFMYIGIVVLLIALALGSWLSYVRKSRAAIQREKDISEGLLLNILPSSVANELKQKGFADARHYQSATILFSDFKSFTEISEHLNPAELVEEINVCFKAFDEIVTRLGIEKIKTLGDAYMAAGGINDIDTDSVAQTVRAGIEMQDFISQRKKERDKANLPAFEMRIGIHTGPVVAGIVGVKKFQYDLWGDTVNIASRMESNGESGRVNISETTYQHIKEEEGFRFTPRGPVEAKGKGYIVMYFVDYA